VSVYSAKAAINMYPPFIAAVTPFAPKLEFIDTHANPDTQTAVDADRVTMTMTMAAKVTVE